MGGIEILNVDKVCAVGSRLDLKDLSRDPGAISQIFNGRSRLKLAIFERLKHNLVKEIVHFGIGKAGIGSLRHGRKHRARRRRARLDETCGPRYGGDEPMSWGLPSE